MEGSWWSVNCGLGRSALQLANDVLAVQPNKLDGASGCRLLLESDIGLKNCAIKIISDGLWLILCT